MRRFVQKCVSLLILSAMLAATAVPVAATDSGAGVGWSDGEEGFAVRITSYGGEVSRVTAGERFSVQLWICGSDPAAVSIPLSWDPSVAAVMDESTGQPVSTGRKTENDLVRGAGFRPGETCYDNSLNDDYEPLYWNGKPVFTQGDGAGASGYPYINNETGFAKFLYYTNMPQKGSKPQMFLEIYFVALSTGNPQLHFATAADGPDLNAFDPGSPKGLQVSFTDRTDGNIDDIDRVESEVYTDKVKFPELRITDGSEMDTKPVVPPAGGGDGSTGGSAGASGSQTQTKPVETPKPPAEATLKETSHLEVWPYQSPIECSARIARSDAEKIWESDEYEVGETELYEAIVKSEKAGDSATVGSSMQASGGIGTAKQAPPVLVRMPENIIDKEEYAVTAAAAPIKAANEAGVKQIYFETPLGYIGLECGAVAAKSKDNSLLRIAVKPVNLQTKTVSAGVKPVSAEVKAMSAGTKSESVEVKTVGAGIKSGNVEIKTVGAGTMSGNAERKAVGVGVKSDGVEAGKNVQSFVSLKIDGKESQTSGAPTLRLLIPYQVKSAGTLPVVMTDRAFGASGVAAPLAVSRYDVQRGLVLVQAPAGGTVSLREQKPLTFKDMKEFSWAEEDVNRLSQLGIVSGTAEGVFSPDQPVTREQTAKMATAALGLYDTDTAMPFRDIGRDNPFYSYIASAAAKGMISGVAENRFDGESPISRQDLAVIVHKACAKAGIVLPQTSSAPVFVDDTKIAPYAKDAVYALVRAGIISGVGNGLFEPEGTATRAETGRILGAVSRLTEQLL